MAGFRVPMREPLGFGTPQLVPEFGKRISEKLEREDKAKRETRERSGLMSAGKLGKPTLWQILDLLDVPDKEFDGYLLGKFKRGNDVEDRAIEFLTGIEAGKVKPGEVVKAPKGAILGGDIILQDEAGYRGGKGYVDLTQVGLEDKIRHEIKSVNKLAYDKVAATGGTATAARKRGEEPTPEPYLQHCLQLAWYCFDEKQPTHRAFLHYLNADDYRLCSFSINPEDYREEIDYELDQLDAVIASKQLPAFEGFLPWHKLKNYWSYADWNELSPQEMMDKLEREFPEQYKKFMEMEIK